MQPRRSRRERPPLDRAALDELALRYVGRFATTRAKLRQYLQRKVRERGWVAEQEPDLEAMVERLAARGYVDDAGFALAKSRSLIARGYGKKRLIQSLRAAGVQEDHGEDARANADTEAVSSALRFAQRKRIGPYANDRPDPKGRDRLLAAMLRAGHPFALSRAILDLAPGASVDREMLSESLGSTR